MKITKKNILGKKKEQESIKTINQQKKIKLLFILPSTTIGGAEVQASYLLNGLDKNKFEIYCGLLYKNNELQEAFNNENIKIIHFNKKSESDIFVYFRILDFIKKNNIDIIQTFLGNHHAYLPYYFFNSKKNNKLKCILGIRASSERKGFFLDLMRYKLPRFIMKFKPLLFISNSNRAKKIYVENKVPEKNILVIENGIDLDKFNKKFDKKKIRSEFFLRDEDFLIGMVGRLMESKNQILLIEILSKLKNSFEYTDLRKEMKNKFNIHNIKLLIVGDGPNRKNLENRIKELQLEKEVILTGSRKDIPELMSIMNIFAFPSLFPEGWPNVIGEAMASKLPIIAYDKGDIKEILTNNFDALITETNPEIFEKKLVELILNEKLRKKLSENALKSVQRFSLKNMIKKYEDVYLNYENYVK